MKEANSSVRSGPASGTSREPRRKEKRLTEGDSTRRKGNRRLWVLLKAPRMAEAIAIMK